MEENNMKDYDADVEDKGYYWLVKLIDKRTGKPRTWVNVEKSEFPSKDSAITYLTKRYETKTRKKKSKKSKVKRKPVKKCRCK